MIFIGLLRWLLYPLSKWVCKSDFARNQGTIDVLFSENEKQRKKMEELTVVNEKYKSYENTLVEISSSYERNYLELTKNNEPVIISYRESNLEDIEIRLMKICDNHSATRQCHISTHYREKTKILPLLKKAGVADSDLHPMICICDIISEREEKQKGYARTLLSFLIKLANEQHEYKSLVGWLSYEDRTRHHWLKKFYESLGFEVYLFDNEEGVICKRLNSESDSNGFINAK